MIKKALWGVKWLIIQQFVVQGVNLGSLIYLSALIPPEVHGFFTIAMIGVTLTSVLGSIGLNELILKDQETDLRDKLQGYLGIIIFLSVIFFFISSLFGLIVSYSYSSEFGFRLLMKFALILSLIALVTPLRSYIEAVRSKNLDFKRLSLYQVGTLVLGVTPSLFLANFGYDYYALASRFLLPHLFYVVFGFFFFNLSFKFKFSLDAFGKLKSFSLYYSLNNIVNYFVRNIDYIIIGKLFSPEILGQYTIAYKILLFPLKNVTSKIVQVGMPMLAKVINADQKFKYNYFVMIEAISLITIPIMLFVSVNGGFIVSYLFNDDYPLLGEMIEILALVGALQSVISPVGMLFYFKENTKLMFKTSIFSFFLIFTVFYFGSLVNDIFLLLKLYAITYAFLILPNSTIWIYRSYNFSILDLVRSTKFYLLSAVLSVFLSLLVIDVIQLTDNGIIIFMLNVLLVFILYSFCLIAINKFFSKISFIQMIFKKVL